MLQPDVLWRAAGRRSDMHPVASFDKIGRKPSTQMNHQHRPTPRTIIRGQGHTHGIVDPSITTSERGLWAIKWSFVGLAATAVLQLVVVFVSGSVALLADTIHNFGDAATAIPLAIAFWFARKKPSERFTFGYGRVEDLAGRRDRAHDSRERDRRGI